MKIIKRNGSEVSFDEEKIAGAIEGANSEVSEENSMTDLQIGYVAGKVKERCEQLSYSPSVEEIQKMVENELMAAGFYDVARHYILYRYAKDVERNKPFKSQEASGVNTVVKATDSTEHSGLLDLLSLHVKADFERKTLDARLTVDDVDDNFERIVAGAGKVEETEVYNQEPEVSASELLNYKQVVDDYLHINDWRVKENSTVTYSVGGLILSNSGAVTANYWLSEVYDEEIAEAHRSAAIHLHDLSMLTGYCAGWSLKQLIQEGLGGIPGKITSSPASHLSTLCNQMVNFLGIMQNEWAGAQAFSSFDTYLAPFVKVDNLTQKEVKQCIQSFVFGVNTPSRWGTQAPFSNITLDWVVPNDLVNLNAIVGGKEMDFTYGDCQKEMDMINKAFIEVMIEGDANGRGFQYPIPTYSITRDFNWDETENNKLLFEMTAKYGTPYFSNYINSDMEPSDVRSMCPLTPDTLVVVRSKENGIRVDTIHNIFNTYQHHGTVYDVWTGSGWCNGKPVQTPKTDVYEIEFSNGYSVRMGSDHLQPTRDYGTLHADELEPGMWIPFSKGVYGSDLGTYDLGYVIGAYAGDGSHDDSMIIYSLDAKEKDDETEAMLTRIWKALGFDVKTRIDSKGSVRFVRVNGNPYDVVSKYVYGDIALEKGFTNKTFNASPEFKKGVLDGFRATDGSREKQRIYTSSPILRDHLNILLSSLGMKCTQTFTDDAAREGRYSDNVNYTVAMPQREKYGDYFDEDEQYIYYSIKSISKCKYSGNYLYCFEIDNEDHLFALANGLITHNCRLRLDLRELRKKSGGFFGSGESTGSIGVVTINLPRIAYLATSEADFYEQLDHLMDVAARSLHTKRAFITALLEQGLYPYTKRYLGNFDNHFSTIGLIGMNEVGLNAKWLRSDLTDVNVQRFAKDVLNHMRERLSDYQEKYGDLYNLEATPAESTTYRFAKHDKERYPDIITANMKGTPYYTNSSHLPVGFTEDVFSALDIQDELQTLYTSGTVFHAFLGEKLPDWKAAASLVRKIAENYKLPYYTMSPTYSVCKEHGYLVGEHFACPHCGEKTEVYSRITGYYRPVQNWNDGKAQEYKDRKVYDIANSKLTHQGLLFADMNEVIKEAQQEVNDCPPGDPIMESFAPEDEKLNQSILLFKTASCPNCKAAVALLDKAGISYKSIDANEEVDLVAQYGVKQAPTIVVVDGDEFEKHKGVSNIKGWIKSQKK